MTISNNEKFLPRRIFDLGYGKPASGKSANIKQLIKQMHRETGKKARVLIWDGSLASYEALIELGIVEAVEVAHRPWPQDVLFKLADGHFPAEVLDPNSPLVKPDPKVIKDIGMWVFEGIATVGAHIMGHTKGGLAWRSANGEKIGEASAIKIVEQELDAKTGKPLDGSPGTAFGGNPPAHFGHTQRVIDDGIQRTKMLPGHVFWTTHEVAAEQEQSFGERGAQTKVKVGEMIIGPEGVGKARTGTIQRNFGQCMHFQTVSKMVRDPQNKDEHTGQSVRELDLERRIYTRDHFSYLSEVQVRHLAATRDVGDDFPLYFTNDNPGMAILDLYRALKEQRMKEAI